MIVKTHHKIGHLVAEVAVKDGDETELRPLVQIKPGLYSSSFSLEPFWAPAKPDDVVKYIAREIGAVLDLARFLELDETQIHTAARLAGLDVQVKQSASLTREQWEELNAQFERTPPPAINSETGEHLRLISVLNSLGRNPQTRAEAVEVATQLLEMGWVE